MAGIGHNGGPPVDEWDDDTPDYSDLEGMSLDDILRAGQKAIFVQLVGRCRGGKATHQELAILRNVLKDNGLTLGIPPEKTEGEQEAPAELPDFGTPEWEK